MVKAFPLNQQEYSYNAQDVSYYYAGRHSGVFALDTNCQVSIVSNMTIKVAKGKGWLAHGVDYGVVFWMEEDVLLTVPVGDVASPRWDFVCVGWETTEVKNNPTIYIKSGSPAVTPAEPILENSANKIEICLAKIYVPSGTTNLRATDVTLTDTRADKAYCGLVGDDLRTTNLEERATSLENRTTSLEGRTSSLETETSNLKNRTTNLENGTTPAGKATKLLNARTINGTAFDGSSNITTPKWGQGRNLTIDGVTKLIDGSADINFNTIKFPDLITLRRGEEYTYYGCTKVGEKHLVRVTVPPVGDGTAKLKIVGQGVDLFVVVFQELTTGSQYDDFPIISRWIRGDDYNYGYYKVSGLAFIMGVES